VTEVLLATCQESGEAGAFEFQKFIDALDSGELLDVDGNEGARSR
jgi:hypothetical protein